MKLHYYPETDSLYIEFQQRPSIDTREIAPDVRLDVDEEGRPVGLDIDHASEILDLDTLEIEGLPLRRRHGEPALADRPPHRWAR